MASSIIDLRKFAWLSIATAVATITFKAGAYYVTGSVSLLSDAMESVVNLMAAIVALLTLSLAMKPADARYHFGRTKAEYFSAGLEGAMIFGAATLIIVSAVERIFNPRPLDSLGMGIVISTVASLVNGSVSIILLRAGRKHRSPTLIADAKHLWTDVLTSIGVIAGVLLVSLTGWTWLDPIVAIIMGLNIIRIGVGLVRESFAGLMDVTLPDEENQIIINILKEFSASPKTSFHGLQTRQAGRLRMIQVDAQVPGSWTVSEGHNYAHQVVDRITAVLPDSDVFVHVEPIEDPESYNDIPEGFILLDGADGNCPVDPETGEPI